MFLPVEKMASNFYNVPERMMFLTARHRLRAPTYLNGSQDGTLLAYSLAYCYRPADHEPPEEQQHAVSEE